MITIVCAAIREKSTGIVFSLPKPKRHHHILHALHAIGTQPAPNAYYDQGFITSEGIFVGRVEAAHIVLKASQATQLISPPALYSEDLW
jgi:hypothetical protein